MSDESVSLWLDELKDGSPDAAQVIWQRYYDQLVRLAKQKLSKTQRRSFDEEDVALSAFDSFFRSAEAGRFPKLEDREDLWKLLFVITERKALKHIKHEQRQKRGGGQVRGLSAFKNPGDSAADLWDGAAASREPTPEFAAEVADQVENLLHDLQDDSLRKLAMLKMAGYTNQEAADQLGCSERSVKRKLMVIHTIWSEHQRDGA